MLSGAMVVVLVAGARYVKLVYQSYQRETYGITIVWSRTAPLIITELPHRKLLLLNTGVSQDMPALVSRWRYFFEKKIDYIVTTGTQSYAKRGLYWLAKKFSIGEIVELSADDQGRFGSNEKVIQTDTGSVRLLPLLNSKGRCIEECAAFFVCRKGNCFLYTNVFRKSSQKSLADYVSHGHLKIKFAYLGKVSSGDQLSKELASVLNRAQIYLSPSGKKADAVWSDLVQGNQDSQAKEKPLTLIRVPVGEEVFLQL